MLYVVSVPDFPGLHNLFCAELLLCAPASGNERSLSIVSGRLRIAGAVTERRSAARGPSVNTHIDENSKLHWRTGAETEHKHIWCKLAGQLKPNNILFKKPSSIYLKPHLSVSHEVTKYEHLYSEFFYSSQLKKPIFFETSGSCHGFLLFTSFLSLPQPLQQTSLHFFPLPTSFIFLPHTFGSLFSSSSSSFPPSHATLLGVLIVVWKVLC